MENYNKLHDIIKNKQHNKQHNKQYNKQYNEIYKSYYCKYSLDIYNKYIREGYSPETASKNSINYFSPPSPRFLMLQSNYPTPYS